MVISRKRLRIISMFLIAFLFFTLTLVVFHTIVALAQCEGAGGFVPLECFQGSRKLSDAYNTAELGPFLQKVFVGAISLGAILAVLRLAYAGFVYMASDLWTSKEKAKEIIKDTLLGLFLLLAIWLILHQINPDILKLDILQNIKPAPTVTGQQTQAPAPTAPEYCYTPLFGGETCGFTTKQAWDSSWAIFGSACYLKGSK